MQCEPHHWPVLKKRIMDLFYEYENFRSQPQQPNINQNMQNHYYHQNYNISPGSVNSNIIQRSHFSKNGKENINN